MQDFKNLDVWMLARQQNKKIFEVTKSYPAEECYRTVSQMRGASLSIMSNIAEGCGREGNGELGRFLQFSMGSAFELESLLYASLDMNYLRLQQHADLDAELQRLKKMMFSFYRRVRAPRSH